MNFYQLLHDSEKGFAWAGGYGPIDDLWFLLPAFLASKRAFWRINPRPPGMRIDPNGTKWPDILGCGFAPPDFFLSERVVQSLRKLAPLGRITEMPIAEIKAKALKNEAPPRYFVVETIPGIEVDFAASNMPVDTTGKPIPSSASVQLKVKTASWGGRDIFGFSNYDPSNLTILCTERVKEVAEREGWTNAWWRPLADV
jgi:hypothetical protein